MTNAQSEKIVWTLEKRKLSSLKSFEKNPRKITREKMGKLVKNLEQDGLIDKPVINIDGTVIGGHQRISALKSIGVKEVDVWVPDRQLDKEYEKGLNIRLNIQFGQYDDDILANEYQPEDLIDWGFVPEELGGFDPEEHEPIQDEDDEPEEEIVKIEVHKDDKVSLLNQLDNLLKGFRAKVI